MIDSNLEPSRNSEPYDLRGNGVVYTPLPVTQVVVAQAMAKLDASRPKTVLEPSCGDGSFIRTLSDHSVFDLYALDKDDAAISKCESEFGDVSLFCGDFFQDFPDCWPTSFDLIVGNPPYVSWHRCDARTRALLDKICDDFGYEHRFLKNAWAGFVVKATMKLSENGVLAFVIPYEFLTVSYGKHLRDWMERQFSSIDIYIPNEKAFKLIDQDAVTIIAAKGKDTCKTTLHRVSSLAADIIQSSCQVSSGGSKSSPLGMKGFLIDADALDLIHKLEQRCPPVSDFCESAAGTVTAANDFFILSRDDVALYKLKRWARPIIKKSSFLGDTVDFSMENFEDIDGSGKACYLLDFGKLKADKLPKAVERYLAIGEEQGIHQRYKCRHRTDWFKVPVVTENEGFFFKRSHVVPRLCVNSYGALATDSAYHIRMKPGESVHDLCASFYNSLTLLFAEIEGRFYGGGVLELTPNEFRRLPLPRSKFSLSEFSKFQGKFSLSDHGKSAIQQSNSRLRSLLQMTANEVAIVENARQILQLHRLRHGGKGSLAPRPLSQ